MTGVVLVRAVNVDESLQTVLLALLHDDVEDLHAVLESLAVLENEVTVDVAVLTCGSNRSVLTDNVLGRIVGCLN